LLWFFFLSYDNLGSFSHSQKPAPYIRRKLFTSLPRIRVSLSTTRPSRCKNIPTLLVLLHIEAMQRPSARDLLKHKFVRLAKKISYLTELIERHERWKAEGGGRDHDDDTRVANENP
jgi:hypothetical protein